MDQLRNGIGLRAYGQKDPLVEYKTEAFAMFDEMQDNVKNEIANNVFRSASSLAAFENFLRALPQQLSGPDLDSGSALGQAPRPPSPKSPTAGAGKDVVGEAIEQASQPINATSRKSAATNPVPAAVARNTRTAAERMDRLQIVASKLLRGLRYGRE